jgi:hypothetical protein
MSEPVLLVLLGGLISLVSTLSVLAIQHLMEREKTKLSFKKHSLTVVYNEQIEFIKKIYPIHKELIGLMYYIETSNINGNKTILDKSIKLKLQKLSKQYYDIVYGGHYFLPAAIVKSNYLLLSKLYELQMSPAKKPASEFREYIGYFSNDLRAMIGVDPLTKDIVSSFKIGH